MPTTPDQESDFIEDSPGASVTALHILAWLALALATYLILHVICDIASPATPHVRTAAFCAAFLTTALAAAPFIRFILVMWTTRFEEISNRLNNKSLCAYLLQFWENRFIAAAPSLKTKLETFRSCAKLFDDAAIDDFEEPPTRLFETIYNEQYGRTAFITPVILVLAVIAIETVVIVFVLAKHLQLLRHDFAFQMLGATAGTYMFVIGDSVMAARRRSLNISDVYWYALRLFLAAPLGLAIYKIGGDMMGAFVLGTLPVDQFRKVLARYAGSNFSDLEKQAQLPDQLIQLDGVTADISAQLGLEGITSIEQIIGSDPVSLAIRTGLPFKLILALGSQAIVRHHLRTNAALLAGIGLAYAEPVTRLVRDLQTRYPMPFVSPPDNAKSASLWLQQTGPLEDPVLLNALALINADPLPPNQPHLPPTPMAAATLLTAFLRISEDSYTKFLMANDNTFVCNVPGCTRTNRICERPQAANTSVRATRLSAAAPPARTMYFTLYPRPLPRQRSR